MFVNRWELRGVKERLGEVERAVREASVVSKPTRDHTVIVLCKHDKKARRVKFYDPPPVEFVQDGEVLKYVGENREVGSAFAFFGGMSIPMTPTISFIPVYQSSRCPLTCERDGLVINREKRD